MIHDLNLTFALNQRPDKSLGASPTFYPFPTGFEALGNATQALDLAVAMDKGQGYPLVARFEVTTSFLTSDNTLTGRFAIALANSADFLTDPLVLCTSGFFTTSGGAVTSWIAGTYFDLVVPRRLPSVVLRTPSNTTGRRFLFLGLEISTAIGAGLAMFTAGGMNAYLMADTAVSEFGSGQLPVSGWNAAGV